MDLLKVDHTGSDNYNTCPLMYYLGNVLGWRQQAGNTALRFGGAFHAGMEGFYSYIAEHGWDTSSKAIERMLIYAKKNWDEECMDKEFYPDYRTFENLSILLTSYLNHFYQDEGFLEVLHTERAFKLLMKPTAKDEQVYPWIRPFYFTGKIDMECNLSGMNWINEFKTTGWRMDQVKSQLNRSPQIIGYNFASRNVYEVVPEGNFVTIAFASSRKSPKTGNYGKLTIDFARVPQIFNEVDVMSWREHFIHLVARIQLSIEMENFPPNFKSCYNYGRCKFLNICEQSRPISEASFHGYVQEEPWDVTKEVAPDVLMKGEE